MQSKRHLEDAELVAYGVCERGPMKILAEAAEVVARHAQGIPVARIVRDAPVSRNTTYKALREAHSAVEGTRAPSGG